MSFLNLDFHKPLKSLYLYVKGPDAGVNLLLDKASLSVVTTSSSWKDSAQQRIESIRKGDLTITLQSEKPLKNVEVKVKYCPIIICLLD